MGPLLIDVQRHHGMNFPRRIARKMASSVRLIFESVANVEERSAGNGDDRRIAHVQFLCRASVKREFRSRPTENGIANLTPFEVSLVLHRLRSPAYRRSHQQEQCEGRRPFQI